MGIEINEQEMQDFIREAYEQNFELLRLETGIALSPEAKRAGLQQVLFYWQKMREVAMRVSETEVRLSLPGNESPGERIFGIEGVVDIVREEGQTIIYDIKTHNADYVRSHIDLYEDQLNVYAHIWKELQKQPLDGTALICTEFPAEVKEALQRGDQRQLERALADWEPLIEIEFDRRKVKETIRSFGEVVDKIEDHEFSPPPVEKLQEQFSDDTRVRFGTHVCRNCDVRFSCDAYRAYVRRGRGREDHAFEDTYSDLEAGEPLEEWRTAGLEMIVEPEELA
jgi:hypothetical protein